VLTQGSVDRRNAGVPLYPLTAAREAYVRGDFPLVLDLLGHLRLDEPVPAEAWLLRARALLRLRRPADIVAELEPRLSTIVDVDERATAAMLHGAALARLDPAQGIAQLAIVADAADRYGAHRAVRAEISHFRALAYWSIGELENAERLAYAAQRDGRDVLSVRAMQLRAFIAGASPRSSRYRDALTLFRAAARAYGHCRERDVDLATTIGQQIASLEQTLRSTEIRGTHRADRGARALPGSSFAPAVPSPAFLRLCYDDAWLFALDGDGASALRKMREADDAAQTTAWRVWARSACAVVAVFFGEVAAARTYAESAADLAKAVDWNATIDDERLAFVHLAETYATLGDARAAATALARFDAISGPVDPILILRYRTCEPRFIGWFAHVTGLVRRGAGDIPGAVASFEAAVEAFRSCGYLWREALSLIELDATTGTRASNEHLERAAALVREHFPSSFLTRRFGGWTRLAMDPLFAAVTPAERDVLRHLLEGRSQREIAEATGRAYNTVRTQVQALHRKMGTNSELQIVATCARRGIGPPLRSSAMARGPSSAHAASPYPSTI
jgi:DNA-binding CsgD family transcriptional regulator